jgi:dihydroorotate dehydrogenase (NAD+) catalytic subunit
LSYGTGGLSGPAIRPIAVRMVYEVAKAVDLPLIGIGGIASTNDALEFIIAGATAVQIGTANYYDPAITLKVVDGLSAYCGNNDIAGIGKITRSLRTE